MQDLLEADGRPHVGSGPMAARWCMDKIGTKLAALAMGVPTGLSCLFDPRDERSPLEMPVVLKPTHDGSSVGLHMCRDTETWALGRNAARQDIEAHPYRSYMVERLVQGRELTVGLLGFGQELRALPIVEIGPASGVYDYDAKYNRSDTKYTVDPELPAGVGERVSQWALRLAQHVGVRDLARVDFLLDREEQAWLLELNTMPGFTATSLLPKAARAVGLDFQALCDHLIDEALQRA